MHSTNKQWTELFLDTGEVKMPTGYDYQNQVLAKAADDDGFRIRLMNDPSKAVGEELDVDMPEELDIRVHEETANLVHLVLPSKRVLSREELENTTGGNVPPMPPQDVGW